MREILFRGKRVDNCEWIEGSFLQDGEAHRLLCREDLPCSDCCIVPKTDMDNVRCYLTNGILLNIHAHHVIPSTVSQYTGLKDKNGKRIFEGDIVRVTYAVNGREKVIFTGDVKFEDGAFYLCLYSRWRKTKGLLCGFANAVHTEDEGTFCEVIGNIHDNPELLERRWNDV
jgi:uncharacterized phage protein (TIGR01671 family)